jgi:hypothetical protein
MNDRSDLELFDALAEKIKRRVPGFKIRYKNESKWQWFLSKLLFFNKDYLTKFVTTSKEDVWYPSREYITKNRWKAFKILAHEYVHLLDWQMHPILFQLMYVFPQVLSLLSLLSILAAFFSNWWLTALSALLFLLPIRSFTRAQIELRGYTMSLAVNFWRYASVQQKTIDRIAEHFTGWRYYRMYPKEKVVEEWLEEAMVKIRAVDRVGQESLKSVMVDSAAFEDVYELMTGIEFDPDPGEVADNG